MKRKIFFVLFIPILLISCSKFTNDEEILNYVSKHGYKYYNYFIDSKIEGNFTNSGQKEILFFFNTEEKPKIPSTLKDTFLFVFNAKGSIINAYRIPYNNYIVGDRNYIKEIDRFETSYSNAIITDFNQNGVLEFIYFDSAGSVYEFDVVEFKNGEFQYISPANIYNYDLDHFDFENKSMYLSDRESTRKIKLTWNPETEFYEKEVLE